MQLFNTTEDVIEDMFHRRIILIGPGEVKSVTDDAGKHMIRRNGCKGLVSLDYGEKEEQLWGSLRAYKDRRRQDGLKMYKEWLTHSLNQDSESEKEIIQKNGGKVEAAHSRQPYFKNKIKEIEALMRKKDETVVVRKMGRPKKVTDVEQTATKSESPSVS